LVSFAAAAVELERAVVWRPQMQAAEEQPVAAAVSAQGVS